MIEGEGNHHRKERGWTYRVSYVGLDGSLQRVVPTTEMKQSMKSAGMGRRCCVALASLPPVCG